MALGLGTKVASAYVSLGVDDRGLTKGLKQAEERTHHFSNALKVGLGAAMVGAGVALYEGTKAVKAWYGELKESEKVAAQTAAVIKSTGGAANVTAKQVDALAASILRKSGIDDEAIKSGENMLLTFKNIRNEQGKGNDIFNQTTKVLADMNTAMTHGNVTAESMAKQGIQLGKALNDPIKGISALARVGVQFTDSQKETIKHLVETGHVMDAQKIILRELTSEFGGSAKAMGDTFGGQLNILKETFMNVGSDLLRVFIPAIKQVAQWLTDALPTLEAWGSALIDKIRPALQTVVDYIRQNWPAIKDAFKQTADFIQQQVFPILEQLGQAFGRAAQTALRALRGALPAIQGALRGVMTVARQLANFLSTDFGRNLAIAAIAVFGLVKAIGAARTAIRTLAATRINPWVTGTMILLAALSTAFLKNRDKVLEDAAAYLRLRDAAHRLRDSAFDLRQAQLDVIRDTRASRDADEEATKAKKKYGDAVKEHGRHSKEAQASLKDYRQKALDAKQADLDLAQSHARLADATKHMNDGIKDAHKDLKTMTNEAHKAKQGFDDVNPAFDLFGDKAHAADKELDGFRQATKDIADKFGNLASKVGNVNPKLALNARHISEQAKAAHQLSINIGDIPDFEKVKAEVGIHFSIVGQSKQGGGFIEMTAGAQRGKDSVLTFLAPGEMVLNEGQQAQLGGPRTLASMFGFSVPQGMAAGGFVGSTGKTNSAIKSGVIVIGLDEDNWPVPPALMAIKAKANEIDSHGYHYAVGGGNAGTGPSYGAASWSGGPQVLGYDCSGSINTVLTAGGFPVGGYVSANYLSWGGSGAGPHMTIYAKPGSGGEGHVYSDIDGVGFGTSSENPGGGAGWFSGGPRVGYSQRHPPGLARGGISVGRLPAVVAPGEVVLTPAQQSALGGTGSLVERLGLAVLYSNTDQGIMPGLAAGALFAGSKKKKKKKPITRHSITNAITGATRSVGGYYAGQRKKRHDRLVADVDGKIAGVDLKVPHVEATRNHASRNDDTPGEIAAVKQLIGLQNKKIAIWRNGIARANADGFSSLAAEWRNNIQTAQDNIQSYNDDLTDLNKPDTTDTTGTDAVSGTSWGELPSDLQEQEFDASQTEDTADDLAVLGRERAFLTAQLGRATTSAQRLAVKQAIKAVDDKIKAIKSGGATDAGIDPQTGQAWGQLPDAIQEEIFDAQATASTADDATALAHAEAYLNAELARAKTPGQRLAVKQALKSVRDTLAPQAPTAADTGPTGPSGEEVAAQMAAILGKRSSFFSSFAPNIFSASSAGFTLGATPLGGPGPAVSSTPGKVTVIQHFKAPDYEPHVAARQAAFFAEAAFG